jgi:coenzyme F420 biosynthesis associated uncharacterized protein
VTLDDQWAFAGRVAGLVARDYPLAQSYHLDHLSTEMDGIVRRANDMVAESTGLAVPGMPQVAIVDRRQWVERNLASFSRLIGPAEQRLAERLDVMGDESTAHDLARRMMATETGVVLGFLSRKVLGQYELVIPNDTEADSIAFIGANVLHIERAHQLRPADFRLWIALHEAAHRAQFVGVGWMREYFFGLVEELVASARPEPGRLRRLVREAYAAMRQGSPMIDERGLLGLLGSPHQREALDRVQALMCLLEGHGHVVMDRLGDRTIRTQRRMSALLKARRRDPRTAMFFRLTGMEMKIRQYEMGERFVLAVERRSGWRTLDLAWTAPEALPTLDEVEEPERWLARVG